MLLLHRGKELYWPTKSIYDFIVNEVKQDKISHTELAKIERVEENTIIDNPIKPSNEYK